MTNGRLALPATHDTTICVCKRLPFQLFPYMPARPRKEQAKKRQGLPPSLPSPRRTRTNERTNAEKGKISRNPTDSSKLYHPANPPPPSSKVNPPSTHALQPANEPVGKENEASSLSSSSSGTFPSDAPTKKRKNRRCHIWRPYSPN